MYQFQIALAGLLCTDCREWLAGAEVRLVRPRQGSNLVARAVAETKDTFELLTEARATQRARGLLGRGVLDAQGRATIELAEGYEGGPFEVDVVVRQVPGQKRTEGRGAVSFSLTTLQPKWVERGQHAVAGWEHVLSAAWWCGIRGRLGAWVVCGQVVDRDSGVGLPGLVVRAFDTDLFQDDGVGTATTGADGRFRIDYALEDFDRTPYSPGLNFEFFPGPDLYFHVDAAGGGELLREGRAVGRTPGRGNSRPCTCVRLQVSPGKEPPVVDPRSLPYWTKIGDFQVDADIQPGDGRSSATPVPRSLGGTHGTKMAFRGKLLLGGIVPWKDPATGNALRYRFRMGPIGAEVPLGMTSGELTQVASRLVTWKLTGDTLQVYQVPVYVGSVAEVPTVPSAATPGPWGPLPRYVVAPDADGWVVVDPMSIGGGFGVGGWLFGFESQLAAPGGAPAVVMPGGPPSAFLSGTTLRLVFEVAPVGGAAIAAYGKTLPRLRVNNHAEARAVGVAELGATGVGCNPLDGTMTVLYTTDHEDMLRWGLGVSSSAVFAAPSLPSGPTVGAPRGSSGSQAVNISGWPSCSYTLSITTVLNVTDGLNDDSPESTGVTFCIDRD